VAGNDAQHQVAVAANDTISLLVTTSGTSGNLRNATFGLLNAPNTGPVWVLEGYSTSVPDQWNGTGQVRGGCTLTWDQLLAITDATLGDRISPGLLQTLISTARGVIPFLTAVWPTAYADLGIPAPPANCRGYLNDWLLTGVHSILLGVAYIRKGYNKNLSRFDLPLVGAAYNAGGLSPVAQGQWGLHYFGDYMANAGPHLNVATDRISTNTLAPAARVRLMD
jgi:hypothetical protein